jgi:hypothetical protein
MECTEEEVLKDIRKNWIDEWKDCFRSERKSKKGQWERE